MSGIVTIITDFSSSDHYVGVMKGVLLSINPDLKIVDIAHSIEAHDVGQAAFVLKSAYKYFPPGTVHLVVVDPGVGSERRRIAMHCGEHYFIGPDNGVFSYPVEEEGLCQCVEIKVDPDIDRRPTPTFEGRDVFAPTAAKIALGTPLSEVGEIITDPVQFSVRKPKINKDSIEGQVVYIDHFGNCSSNISAADLAKLEGEKVVSIGGLEVGRIVQYYSEAEPGEALALVNSMDHLEVAVNKGNAREELNVHVGTRVRVTRETSDMSKL